MGRPLNFLAKADGTAPNNVDAWYNKGDCYSRINRKKRQLIVIMSQTHIKRTKRRLICNCVDHEERHDSILLSSTTPLCYENSKLDFDSRRITKYLLIH